MKNIFSLLLICSILLLGISCNDEWKDEQYKRYVSFKAPLNDQGVTRIYVRYKEEGSTTYKLPLIVSGSTTNSESMTAHVALDPDTLTILNMEQYQDRTELYYKEL